jgi:hypothetical protein
MLQHKNNLKYENNIEKVLARSVKLFKKCNLNELATKWEKILRNYRRAKKLR